MFNNVESQLDIAEILPHKAYHKEGAIIIRELLEKESISKQTYFDLLGDEVGRKLLGKNVFAYHFASKTVTFQSTVVAQFCKEYSAFWGKKNPKDA
jgi:hypothetical protein